MKTSILKLLAVLFLTALFPIRSAAFYSAKHGLVVKHLHNWAPKYLTVINNYENLHFENAPSTLRFLSVITSVNGNSTEYMSEEEFYRIIDQPGEMEISYMTKLNGENKNFSAKMIRRNGFLVYSYSDVFDSEYRPYMFKMGNGECCWPTMINDNDVDFFEYSTFDYAYGDEAEEFEKKFLLSRFAQQLEEKGMKRVSENPDIYIYITQDISRNIETVYHPIVTSDTYSSSAGRSWVGSHFISYNSNGHSSTVTRESGRFGSQQMNDVYMQISLLDAKKVDSKAAPKIWQFTANERFDKSVTEKLFENFAEVGGRNYPFGTDTDGIGIVYHRQLKNTGMLSDPLFSSKSIISKLKILYVIPGSWAESIKIKKGSLVYSEIIKSYISISGVLKPWLIGAYQISLTKRMYLGEKLFDSMYLREMPETSTYYIDPDKL